MDNAADGNPPSLELDRYTVRFYEEFLIEHHPIHIDIERSIAKGIVLWIDRQPEIFQERYWSQIALYYDDKDYVAYEIWNKMAARQWLERHVMNDHHTGYLWRFALTIVHIAHRENELDTLRTFSWNCSDN